MKQICPHCGVARKPSDVAPAWQCPACEKAYHKAGGDLPPASLRVYSPHWEQKSGKGKWLVLLLLIGAAFWLGRPLWQAGPSNAVSAAPVAGQPAVVLYMTDWCGYCKASKAFFKANGIAYVEHDIEKSTDAQRQHKRLGGGGVPLIVIGDELVRGYNEPALRQLLRPWLKG